MKRVDNDGGSTETYDIIVRLRTLPIGHYVTGIPTYAVGLPPNTPPQVDAIPISNICWQCFGRGKAFVRTLAVC